MWKGNYFAHRCTCTCMHVDRQADRQTDRQADRQTDRHTYADHGCVFRMATVMEGHPGMSTVLETLFTSCAREVVQEDWPRPHAKVRKAQGSGSCMGKGRGGEGRGGEGRGGEGRGGWMR